MKQFESPERSLGALDSEAVARLITTAADIALVLDSEGIVLDVAFQREQLGVEVAGAAWTGRAWLSTVTPDSEAKISALMSEATAGAAPRWRQVNHPTRLGTVPILYSVVQAGEGRFVAVGRDLQAVASLQQRLVDAQQSMERDYSRLRNVETRYRLLFQMSLEPFLIVDAATVTVIEANPAAERVLRPIANRIQGRPMVDAFDAASTQPLQALLAIIRATGRADDARVRLADGGRELDVSASLFRQENVTLFLVRLSPAEAETAQIPKIKWKLLKFVESAPDGFVIANADGRIVTANSAFLDMAQLAAAEQAQGESLDRWLGQSSVDLRVLLANLRQHGAIRLFASTLRGELGASTAVEISAILVMNSERECFGFSIRNVGRRLRHDAPSGAELPRSVEQLTELVGRIPLKDLVRETTDIIEKLSIETALEMTGDNRASAAEMLGLSRQSLYVKLRRYRIAEFSAAGPG